MIVLGIDTATPQVSVALGGPAGLAGSFSAAEGRRHGEVLAPAIETLVRLSGVGLDRVDAVAVDTGPGLFTGLRVGLATAQALASALGVDVVGRCSLELLAYPHRRRAGIVAAVVDARRGEVFWALYRDGRELRPPALGAPAAVGEALAALVGPVLAVGDGARRYASELAGGPDLSVAGAWDAHPSAVVLVELAAGDVSAGRTVPPGGLFANYLRSADVRIGWAERPTPERPTPERPTQPPTFRAAHRA